MKCRIQTVAVAVLILALGGAASVCAATWNNSQADGDINNAANWGGTIPSGTEGAVVGPTTPLAINQVFTNGTDNRAAYLVTGAAGLTIAAGGSFIYTGDGLLGSTGFGAGGASTITHTGGTLTQDGGGAGCLIGHNAVGTYNISGGNLNVVSNCPALQIDHSGGSDGSSLNISGTGRVDVGDGVDLVINAGGTLTVTGDGLLVWHNRTVDQALFAGSLSAQITQVGSNVHFTAPVTAPEPIGDGTVIGVDFGPAAPVGNYNQYNRTSGGTMGVGTVINTSGAVVSGISLTITAPTMWSNDDAADSTDLPGQPAFFDDTHLTDWIGEGTAGLDIDLTFSGLDDSLIYKLVIGSGFIKNDTSTDTDWTVGGQTNTSVHDVGASAYVTFSDLTTDGSGNLVITSDAAASGTPNLTVVSPLRLTASDPTRKGMVVVIK